MKISPLIAAIRQRCPMFGGRVAGASEFKPLAENSKLGLPAAYVIPLDDNAEENRSQTDYWQKITDAFAVVVVVNNTQDARGQASVDVIEEAREALWKALNGWSPDEKKYDGITYQGGNLLDMNRAHLYYQFEFSAEFEIGPEDARQWTDLEALPEFEGLCGHGDQWGIDYISPGLGPDVVPPEWRIIEHQFNFPANTVFVSDYSNMLKLAHAMNDASPLGFAPTPQE